MAHLLVELEGFVWPESQAKKQAAEADCRVAREDRLVRDAPEKPRKEGRKDEESKILASSMRRGDNTPQ